MPIENIEDENEVRRKFSSDFLERIHAVSGEVAYLEKKGRNTQQKYAYAADSDVTFAVGKAMLTHGLVMLPPQVLLQEVVFDVPTKFSAMKCSHVRILFTIANMATGETISGVMDGYGADPSDKGLNKAITSARKYFFFQTFNIATGDDPEHDIQEPPAPAGRSAPPRVGSRIKELQDKIFLTLTTGYSHTPEDAAKMINDNSHDESVLTVWLNDLQDGLKNINMEVSK